MAVRGKIIQVYSAAWVVRTLGMYKERFNRMQPAQRESILVVPIGPRPLTSHLVIDESSTGWQSNLAVNPTFAVVFAGTVENSASKKSINYCMALQSE